MRFSRGLSTNGYLTIPLAIVLSLILFRDSGPAAEKEKPRHGGELVFAVGGTPPSFDGPRETTFAMLHPVAPH